MLFSIVKSSHLSNSYWAGEKLRLTAWLALSRNVRSTQSPTLAMGEFPCDTARRSARVAVWYLLWYSMFSLSLEQRTGFIALVLLVLPS